MWAATFLSTCRNLRIAALPLLAQMCWLSCGPAASNDLDAAKPCTGSNCDRCPAGQMTTIRGVVTAPNGIDPVPGALVYVPVAELTAFPAGIRCEACQQLVGATTAITSTASDGSFVLGPVPTQGESAHANVVTQMGRFRSARDIAIDVPCGENRPAAENFRLPGKNNGVAQTIPRIAVAQGQYDSMECVLRGMGVEEFDLYEGNGFTSGTVGSFGSLLRDSQIMRSYNIIFINCANDYEYLLSLPGVRQNIESYVADGGRLYVTDWSYDYIEQVPSFAPVIDFEPGASDDLPEAMDEAQWGRGGIVVAAKVLSSPLVEWLTAVERVTGDVLIDAADRVRIEGLLGRWVPQYRVPPADHVTVWIEGNADGVRPLTTTFEQNQCGRVLFSSYHTVGGGAREVGFPEYCSDFAPSPQERVLEYLIFHIASCITIE